MYCFGEDDHRYGNDNKQNTGSQIECERFAEHQHADENGGDRLHCPQYGCECPADIMDGEYECDIGDDGRDNGQQYQVDYRHGVGDGLDTLL